MKRFFVLLLCLCAVLAGCGQTDPVPAEPVHPSHEDAVVPVEYRWGDYVNITMELPDGWEWAGDEQNASGEKLTDIPERQGFWFWKTDAPELRFSFSCWPQGFGMCGTGVEFTDVNGEHNLTLAEEQGIGVVAVTIIFNDVPGSYLVAGSIPNDLWEQYRDTVVGMADSAVVAEGCMTRDEAVDAIRSAYNWPSEDCEVYGRYDAAEGVWHLRFDGKMVGGEEFTNYAQVNSAGVILQLSWDEAGNEPVVFNESDNTICGLPLCEPAN